MIDLECIVLDVISKAPDWLRRDLTSADPAALSRAEETLAARIKDALEKEVQVAS